MQSIVSKGETLFKDDENFKDTTRFSSFFLYRLIVPIFSRRLVNCRTSFCKAATLTIPIHH